MQAETTGGDGSSGENMRMVRMGWRASNNNNNNMTLLMVVVVVVEVMSALVFILLPRFLLPI